MKKLDDNIEVLFCTKCEFSVVGEVFTDNTCVEKSTLKGDDLGSCPECGGELKCK